MSFDAAQLAKLCAQYGRIARVTVVSVQGSAPRETGTSMLVWPTGQDGTIGGGALEFQAAAEARALLFAAAQGADQGAIRHFDRLHRLPLGPALGQCCGGAVTLLTELWDQDRLAGLSGAAYARPLPSEGRDRPFPVEGGSVTATAEGPQDSVDLGQEHGTASGTKASLGMPPKVARRLEAMRNGSVPPETALLQGWLIEPLRRPGRELWIWGAGHVGRALVQVLAPLPDWQITWADTAPDRFPAEMPDAVRSISSPNLQRLVAEAPTSAAHLILTYSHDIDLALCHALLSHGFGFAGLIGSDTKWARFRSRLAQLGHSPAKIDSICCPIGRKSYGKHPQAIAIGVAADLLLGQATAEAAKDATG